MIVPERTPLRLNRHLFTETGTDSGSLNVLGTLVHRFPDEGDYVVEVTKDGDPVGRELLVVSDDYHSVQATFDLSRVGDAPTCACEAAPCTCEAQSFQCIREDGYGVFHVSAGSGGYAVTVDPIETRDVREFDSTELREDDAFAAVLLRPGEYAVRNVAPEAEAESRLTVMYPDRERAREALGEAVEIEASARGFDRGATRIHPGQGLVFRVEDPSRIVIELEEPHEKATAEPGGPVRVRRPPRAPISGVRRATGRVDPADLTTEEVAETVADVANPRELEAMLLAEKREKDRAGARDAIEKRLRDLDVDRRES